MAAAAAPLDTDKAERKVWLVRVPPYVAKQWNEAIAAAAELPIDETSQAKLGHVSLQEGGIPEQLTVVGPDGREERLFMNTNRDAVATSVLSWEPGADGGMKGAKVEGYVNRRFDAAPAFIPQAGEAASSRQAQQSGAGTVDAAYLASTRARLTAAKPSAPRRVAVLDDDREIARLAGGTKDAPLYVRNRQAKQKAAAAAAAAAGEARKKVRLSRDDMEERLMELFGLQSHWHFAQIQKTLDQPIMFIKEVLNEVAIQQVRGPYKEQWELKPVYREAAARQRAAAAAAVAGAAAAAGGGGAGSSGAPSAGRPPG